MTLVEAVNSALMDHIREDNYAGDGYTEPREAWIRCSCDALIWQWQQFYMETEEDPEVCWTDHLTWVAVNNLTASRVSAFDAETCQVVYEEEFFPF